jgi:outer membrane lipopolysaccharide assembly protein LptE/RlpB
MLVDRAYKIHSTALTVASLLIVSIATSLLSGCGFHLRGQANPTPSEAIAADRENQQPQRLEQFILQSGNKKLKQAITNAASLQNIQVLGNTYSKVSDKSNDKSSENTGWQLSINKVERDSIRVSSTQSVSTDQFRLKLSVNYTLSYNGNALKPQNITRQSIFQNDSDQALSKSYEKETIYNELNQQIAAALVQQLQSLSLNPPSCDCDETEPSATEQ